VAPRLDDIDLMLHADGELSGDGARAAESSVRADERSRRVVEAVAEVGEVVRTAVELEVDEAVEAPAFAELWGRIERRLHTNGETRAPATAAAGEPGSGPAVAPAAPAPAAPASAEPRSRGGLLAWLVESRGPLVAGALAAAVTAVLFLAARPFERTVEREVTVEAPARPLTGSPAAMVSQPPEVENIEVHDGSGMILTIPGEGDENPTAVIWIIPDEDTLEDPI
jgi:hypothetical protein